MIILPRTYATVPEKENIETVDIFCKENMLSVCKYFYICCIIN